MKDPRRFATATLLPGGRVLIAGGGHRYGSFGMTPSLGMLDSAELYDPAAGTFSPTGSMAAVRGWHTATLLPDGRVLIAGGSYEAPAELYDPQTGTFSPTGSMEVDREAATATLLPDGRVLIAGGSYEATAELYDPQTGTFSPTGSMTMTAFRSNATATMLPDGRVLIAGGIGVIAGTLDGTTLASAEMYGPVGP